MSWLQRVFLMMSNSALQPEVAMGGYANLTATLPATLPSKADRSHSRKTETLPVIPAEFVGLHGEYDPQGLAKRVAQAFDQHPQVQQIKTLCIIQHGSQITLLGKITNAVLLQQVVELAEQVEGTKKVDVEQVVIES